MSCLYRGWRYAKIPAPDYRPSHAEGFLFVEGWPRLFMASRRNSTDRCPKFILHCCDRIALRLPLQKPPLTWSVHAQNVTFTSNKQARCGTRNGTKNGCYCQRKISGIDCYLET
jgi:hypothetical protein